MQRNYTPLTKLLVILAVLLAAVFLGWFILTASHLPQPQLAQAGSGTPLVNAISAALEIEITLEEPDLLPDAVDCVEDAWYPIPSELGDSAYLTLNAQDAADSTNNAYWQPDLPERGYYRIEAYIPLHDPITWCGSDKVFESDTANAHYTIEHALGSSEVIRSQDLPLNASRWIDLGEYLLPAGSFSQVHLTDLNNETEFTRTVSFSAMRFTYVRPAPSAQYLPQVYRSEAPTPTPTLPPPAVAIQQGAAFDACILPTLSTMQTWWTYSPYHTYAIYLGGISNASCPKADATWIYTARKQGWSFIPTWVGPQAPCSVFKYKMSDDPAEAYLEGRSEAEQASVAAYTKGLTYSGLSGSVIYYDLEGFGGASTECRTAVKSFINGWVERLHELGNAAGVYGGAYASYPADWATLAHVPDYVWLASWYYIDGEFRYDPYASIWIPQYVSNTLWANHQRIRQYAGGHNETWGGKTINIDSNVMDGAVIAASLSSAALPPPLLSQPAASIADTGWLSAEQGWLVQAGRLYWTIDGGLNWQDQTPGKDSDAPPMIQRAVFLDAVTGWALGSAPDGKVQLYHTTDGAAWQPVALPLAPALQEAGGWLPLQLHFNAPVEQSTGRTGFVTLKLATGSTFDIAILLTTRDGGLTWQRFDLPASGSVSFTTPGGSEGWLEAAQGWYHTTDGGLTWQLTNLKSAPTPASLPPGIQPDLQTSVILSGQSPALASAAGLQSPASGAAWVVLRRGQCSGEKLSPDFACSQQDALWVTDGAGTWRAVPQP